jgi:hypothetical protein
MTPGVHNGVQPGVQPALRASDLTPALIVGPLLFASRLEAARCALREAASFMTVFFPVPSEASHTIIRAKIPFSHHRFHRLLAKRDSCPK